MQSDPLFTTYTVYRHLTASSQYYRYNSIRIFYKNPYFLNIFLCIPFRQASGFGICQQPLLGILQGSEGLPTADHLPAAVHAAHRLLQKLLRNRFKGRCGEKPGGKCLCRRIIQVISQSSPAAKGIPSRCSLRNVFLPLPFPAITNISGVPFTAASSISWLSSSKLPWVI